jgi:hypothetical protein
LYTFYASSVLFALFGLKMLHEGWLMEAGDASEECEEAHATLKESEEKGEPLADEKGSEAGMSALGTRRFVLLFRKYLSAVFLQVSAFMWSIL